MDKDLQSPLPCSDRGCAIESSKTSINDSILSSGSSSLQQLLQTLYGSKSPLSTEANKGRIYTLIEEKHEFAMEGLFKVVRDEDSW